MVRYMEDTLVKKKEQTMIWMEEGLRSTQPNEWEVG